MDDLRGELNELKAFIADLKADRAATKEKERREAWTRYVSLTVVLIAVVASIAAQRAGKYSGMGQMSQAQASDQWNLYEAQSIKQHLFELTRDQVVRSGNDPEALKQQKSFDAKIADYNDRKAKIKEVADKLELKRDYAGRVGGRLGLAISLFSVSIATASMCLLTKKKPLWIFAIVLACIGIAEMVAAQMMPMP
ncbi:MAG TPA: DUF4337 domain-containing protein [Candidatus Baltobacteraceae bacterium]|jgi:hypothetical protein|nr:DUF4337 domain-containing protein [Candidatus Baltobacteraceae bacterium]